MKNISRGYKKNKKGKKKWMKNLRKRKRKKKKKKLRSSTRCNVGRWEYMPKKVIKTTKLKILIQMTLGKNKFCLQDLFYNPCVNILAAFVQQMFCLKRVQSWSITNTVWIESFQRFNIFPLDFLFWCNSALHFKFFKKKVNNSVF